ncbi:hypothetical protein PIB30_035557 [Stylosanthes scabra]|uniref:Uncharacterized protein n=1 Tax=Stylosanthes scabra TaxID=79078 RepID=A0ABU6TDW7_9FABA|nr:hypothetical protein [Stylosanthes scabra]
MFKTLAAGMQGTATATFWNRGGDGGGDAEERVRPLGDGDLLEQDDATNMRCRGDGAASAAMELLRRRWSCFLVPVFDGDKGV